MTARVVMMRRKRQRRKLRAAARTEARQRFAQQTQVLCLLSDVRQEAARNWSYRDDRMGRAMVTHLVRGLMGAHKVIETGRE